jgi:hypothetical protein
VVGFEQSEIEGLMAQVGKAVCAVGQQ